MNVVEVDNRIVVTYIWGEWCGGEEAHGAKLLLDRRNEFLCSVAQ